MIGNSVHYVDIYGNIHEEGKSFYKTEMGVRSAVWLKLK